MSEDNPSEDEKLEPGAIGTGIGNAADTLTAPMEPDNQNQEDGEEDENMEETDDESQSEQLEKGELELGIDDRLSPEQQISGGAPSSKLSNTTGNAMINNILFSPDVLISAKKRSLVDEAGNRRLSIYHANVQSRLFANKEREGVTPLEDAENSQGNSERRNMLAVRTDATFKATRAELEA
ncbi:hypothetical protein R1flu_008002 [Riccia fluitans]|uniref:Uncharacterized protein n=1 Tax=Riccia fluitans TaxID=41844 RepID=A0ABD1YAH5_9MARC